MKKPLRFGFTVILDFGRFLFVLPRFFRVSFEFVFIRLIPFLMSQENTLIVPVSIKKSVISERFN